VEVFEAVFPGSPAVARQMFGYPAGFVNGNMFMGLHQENLVLRLPDGPRAELLGMEGAATFEPTLTVGETPGQSPRPAATAVYGKGLARAENLLCVFKVQ